VTAQRSRILIVTIAAGVVLGLLTLGVVSTGGDGSRTAGSEQAVPRRSPSSAPPSPGSVPTVAGPRPPTIDAALRQGSPATAKVTIVEFGDYQCSNCGSFARRTKPELMRRYVDAGVVTFYWRDFPWAGKESIRAAVAARAAGRQNTFWQFHDALYARQFPEGSGRLTDDYLRGIARRLGLDLARYDADRRDPALRKAVDDDYAFGQGLGVPGTPAFLINGVPFFGNQPLSAFVKRIEQARRGS
jgi:protein-disulfide isomerase